MHMEEGRSVPCVFGLTNGLFADSVGLAIRGLSNLEVVGDVEDYAGLQKILASREVRLVLLSHRIVGRFPLQEIAGAYPSTKLVVVVPADSSRPWLLDLLRQGVSAVLPNNIHVISLVRALQLVADHMVVLPASIGFADDRRMEAAEEPAMIAPPAMQMANPLSPREADLLQLWAEGLSDKEISQQLNIGLRTIYTHLERMKDKLGITTRTQAVALGVVTGLVSAEHLLTMRRNVFAQSAEADPITWITPGQS